MLISKRDNSSCLIGLRKTAKYFGIASGALELLCLRAGDPYPCQASLEIALTSRGKAKSRDFSLLAETHLVHKINGGERRQ